MAEKLKLQDQSFKQRHDLVVDALPDDGDLNDAIEREQEVYDEQDEEVSRISRGIQNIIRVCSEPSVVPAFVAAHCSLDSLEEELTRVTGLISGIPRKDPNSIHLVRSYQQKVSDLGVEFSDTKRKVMSSCTTNEVDKLNNTLSSVSTLLFDIGLELRKLADEVATPRAAASLLVAPTPVGTNVKLVKLETPKFDGEVLHWSTFWEQFKIAIHDRLDLNPAQKMAYLR